jgi:hypothetical protein
MHGVIQQGLHTMMLAALIHRTCIRVSGQCLPWRRLTAQGLAEELVNDVVWGAQ